jgi:hypothetical protein
LAISVFIMRVKRADSNQPGLVKQIRKIPGVSVVSIHTVGNGVPDLIIGHKGRTYLAEVKDPGKSQSRKRLTADEEEFHKMWTGHVEVIETIDDVLKMLKLQN